MTGPHEPSDAGDLERELAAIDAWLGRWQLDEAARALDAIAPRADERARAATAVLRARLSAARDEPVDVAALSAALDGLLASACWQLAFDACCLLAAAPPGDLGAARHYRTIAVGCAEAAGAVVLGASQLRQLAAAELAAGDHGRCLAHLDHALRRLADVPLLGARFEQARCHDLAGDALAASGDGAAAREHYDRACTLYTHPDFGDSHRARVHAKRAALG